MKKQTPYQKIVRDRIKLEIQKSSGAEDLLKSFYMKWVTVPRKQKRINWRFVFAMVGSLTFGVHFCILFLLLTKIIFAGEGVDLKSFLITGDFVSSCIRISLLAVSVHFTMKFIIWSANFRRGDEFPDLFIRESLDEYSLEQVEITNDILGNHIKNLIPDEDESYLLWKESLLS